MPTNARLTPGGTNFCPVSDAFCESPGREFWESPGRERRSGTILPVMIGRSLGVVKRIHGAPAYAFDETSDWFDLNIRRWQTETIGGFRKSGFEPPVPYVTSFDASPISTVHWITGVPTRTGSLPDIGWWPPRPDKTWMPATNHQLFIGEGESTVLTLPPAKAQTTFSRVITTNTYGLVGQNSGTLSAEADYLANFTYAQTHCDGFNLATLDDAFNVNGRAQGKTVNEYMATPRADLSGVNMSGFNGAFSVPQGFSNYKGQGLLWASWNYGVDSIDSGFGYTNSPSIRVQRAALKYPATDPLPSRTVRIWTLKTRYDGTNLTELIDTQVWLRDTWYERLVPPFEAGYRSVAVFAWG